VTVRRPTRLLSAALLGAGAAVLVSCGSSGAGLIPAQDAGPLLRDFQAVEAAAKAGHGSCASTEATLRTTESDYHALPDNVDTGLHGKLQEGISKLRELALETCAEPLSQTTTGESTSTTKSPPPSSTTSTTETSPTSTGTATTPPTATTPGSTTTGTEGGTSPGVSGSEGQSGEGAAGGSGQGSSGSSGEGAKGNNGISGGTGSGGTGSGGSGGGEQ
jgi:hypothetical protein